MGEIVQKKDYCAQAFVSCSLREEDKPFVEFVCSILEAYHIKPFGTVGKFSVSPENPVESMNKNIKEADIVVICATPRYIQKDMQNNTKTKGLSEMIHVETGMAIAHNKPVVVFVKTGTDVGKVIPNITQYVEVTGLREDYKEKETAIYSLINNAYKYNQEKSLQQKRKLEIVKRDKENTEKWATIGKATMLGLAVYALIQFVEN